MLELLLLILGVKKHVKSTEDIEKADLQKPKFANNKLIIRFPQINFNEVFEPFNKIKSMQDQVIKDFKKFLLKYKIDEDKRYYHSG